MTKGAAAIDLRWLRANRPGLVAEIRMEGQLAGARAERERLLRIDRLQVTDGVKARMMADPALTLGSVAKAALASGALSPSQIFMRPGPVAPRASQPPAAIAEMSDEEQAALILAAPRVPRPTRGR